VQLPLQHENSWNYLAEWVMKNHLDQIKWIVVIPRVYLFKKKKNGENYNFEKYLAEIFDPLFDATNSSTEQNEKLRKFLLSVSAISISEEKNEVVPIASTFVGDASKFNQDHEPSFGYYTFHFYANLYTFNIFRASKKLNTIIFRPHCRATADRDFHRLSLIFAYYLTDVVDGGYLLLKIPVLNFLYYLSEIGLVCGLSVEGLDVQQNPFFFYYKLGMKIALSSGLYSLFHFTREPLKEDFSIATKLWPLGKCECLEIMRNSILSSGLSHTEKSTLLGKNYYLSSSNANDFSKTGLPNTRFLFRSESVQQQINLLKLNVESHST